MSSSSSSSSGNNRDNDDRYFSNYSLSASKKPSYYQNDRVLINVERVYLSRGESDRIQLLYSSSDLENAKCSDFLDEGLNSNQYVVIYDKNGLPGSRKKYVVRLDVGSSFFDRSIESFLKKMRAIAIEIPESDRALKKGATSEYSIVIHRTLIPIRIDVNCFYDTDKDMDVLLDLPLDSFEKSKTTPMIDWLQNHLDSSELSMGVQLTLYSSCTVTWKVDREKEISVNFNLDELGSEFDFFFKLFFELYPSHKFIPTEKIEFFGIKVSKEVYSFDIKFHDDRIVDKISNSPNKVEQRYAEIFHEETLRRLMANLQ